MDTHSDVRANCSEPPDRARKTNRMRDRLSHHPRLCRLVERYFASITFTSHDNLQTCFLAASNSAAAYAKHHQEPCPAIALGYRTASGQRRSPLKFAGHP